MDLRGCDRHLNLFVVQLQEDDLAVASGAYVVVALSAVAVVVLDAVAEGQHCQMTQQNL